MRMTIRAEEGRRGGRGWGGEVGGGGGAESVFEIIRGDEITSSNLKRNGKEMKLNKPKRLN